MSGKRGHCYRPQGKVMFSEASVCKGGWGVCPRKEGLPPGGLPLNGKSGEGKEICLQEGSAQPPPGTDI